LWHGGDYIWKEGVFLPEAAAVPAEASVQRHGDAREGSSVGAR
jgi:hypothetical protein